MHVFRRSPGCSEQRSGFESGRRCTFMRCNLHDQLVVEFDSEQFNRSASSVDRRDDHGLFLARIEYCTVRVAPGMQRCLAVQQ